MIVCIAGRKGGVGKTTTALQLAGAWVAQGHDVVIVDLDPQLSLSRAIQESKEDLCRIVPLEPMAESHADAGFGEWLRSRLPLAEIYCCDLPPHLGPVMARAVGMADVSLFPTRLSNPDFRSLVDTLDLVTDERHFILPNAYIKRQSSHRSALAALEQSYPGRILEPIPWSMLIETSYNAGIPLSRYRPTSGPARLYRDLAEIVLKKERVLS